MGKSLNCHMIKTIFWQIILIFSLSIDQAFAQAPSWAWAIGGNVTGGHLNSSVVDPLGNLYATGYFTNNTFVLGGVVINNTSGGGAADAFILKCDSLGNVIWAKNIGGIQNDYGNAIAVDQGGNICITGYFESKTAYFLNDTLINTDTISPTPNAFVAKYDANGNELFARVVGSSARYFYGMGIASDTGNNIYVTGRYMDKDMVVGSDTLENSDTLGWGQEVFVVKYNSVGSVVWAKTLGNPDNDWATGVVVDGAGNSYVFGHFWGYPIVFGGDTLTLDATSQAFLVKYDINGNEIWGKKIGSNYVAGSTGICLGTGSSVVITGGFTEQFILGSTVLYNADTSGLKSDIYLARIDSSGNSLWAERIGGSLDEFSYCVATDLLGDVYVSGHFNSALISAGSDTIFNSGGGDLFFAKFSSVGNPLWCKGADGLSHGLGYAICPDYFGNIYVSGNFYSPSFILGNDTLYSQGGSYEIFISKLNGGGAIMGMSENETTGSCTLFPNPFNEKCYLRSNGEGINKVEIVDLLGNVLQLNYDTSSTLQVLDFKNVLPGIYYVIVYHGKNSSKTLVIKQ